jgi:hypothetical protein
MPTGTDHGISREAVAVWITDRTFRQTTKNPPKRVFPDHSEILSNAILAVVDHP